MEINSATGTNNIEIIVPFSDRQNICLEGLQLSKQGKNLLMETDGGKVWKLPKGTSKAKSLGIEKKSKSKKSKMKSNLVEKRKRKLSGTIDCCKKIKRKKKDENMLEMKSVTEFDDVMIIEEIPNQSTIENSSLECAQSSETSFQLTPEPSRLDISQQAENSKPKEKSRAVSGKKLKAVINACNEALNVLTAFGIDVLNSIDISLKILKEHNLLNNKLISLDTLIELVTLALETSKTSEEVVTEQQMNFSKIISNLTTAKNLKNPKTKRNILNSSSSPHSKSGHQNAQDGSTLPFEGEVRDMCAIKDKQNKSQEECDLVLDVQNSNIEPDNNEKPVRNFITNYFKKLDKVSEAKSKTEKLSSYGGKTDMLSGSNLAREFTDLRRQKLDQELENQSCQVNYLLEKTSIRRKNLTKGHESKGKHLQINEAMISLRDEPPQLILSAKEDSTARKKVALIRVDTTTKKETHSGGKMKAKLLQFHDNRRPPYWGTWRRTSKSVKPRKPFGKDQVFNYEVDSDEEWEGEEEPGESLHGSDDEKEPEEDYEVDNEFFVPHGYLSDDENPEKEDVPLNAKLNLLEQQLSSELNQKSRKMAPISFGCLWCHEDALPEDLTSGGSYENLQLKKLQYVPWAPLPIQIESKKDREASAEQEPLTQLKKSRLKVTFPVTQVPNLIKIIHGSPQNSDLLARKFLNHWQSLDKTMDDGNRCNLTKKCVLKKIKELATWQISQDRKKKCWLVSKETQKEFGAEIDPEPPTKNPPRSYIWKFINKSPSTPKPSSSPAPPIPD